ncbi:LysM peptidoglycan-binding domain-containing protein [Candidatus Curtissbacteria bacterium]|nr:LysM peptidoglycan-binding domain-containing protein [Candidatus Curtissbacteria bacterium]
MARPKTKKPAKNKTITVEKEAIEKTKKENLFEQLKLGESYVSLILGAIVVLVLSIVFFVFVKENNSNKNTSVSNVQGTIPSEITPTQKKYVLQEDETLWDVAVKFYGDGFRWPDIVEANKLENPDFVPPGTRLIIPDAK